MDVLFHITALLQNRKTVGIADLGTLYKLKIPGKYDLAQHSFLPPSNTIGFTNKVAEQEELTTAIAQKENIDFPLAQNQISEFVDNLKSQLANQQAVSLAGLGTFTLIENELAFNADQENIFKNEFFGLTAQSELTEPEIHLTENTSIGNLANPSLEEKIETIEPESIIDRDQLSTPKNSDEVENSTIFEEENIEVEEKKSSKLIWISLLIIAIIAAILATTYYYNPTIFDKILNKNLNETSNNLNVATAPVQMDTLQADTNLAAVLDSSVVLINPVTVIDSNITTFEVIGSAERSEKRVAYVINAMRKRGIEAKALDNIPGKLIKISLGSFTDLNLAKKYQDSLRKKLNNPEIYIHTIKPKI